MRGLVDFGFVGDHHEELLREAEERRLARHLWEARRSGSRSGAGGKRDKGVTVRWGLRADDEKVAELLELNGMPRWVAFEERFVVAERDGVVLAALSYRTEPKRMLLGLLVVDPWAGERRMAVALYSGVPALAREMGVREIRAEAPGHGVYPREAGYHRQRRRWRLRIVSSGESLGRQRTRRSLLETLFAPLFRAFCGQGGGR